MHALDHGAVARTGRGIDTLQRSAPRCSKDVADAVVSALKELELAGVLERRELKSEKGLFEYRMTEAGKDLGPIVEAMGFWGQKWVEARRSLKNLDPSLLMWDMRRN